MVTKSKIVDILKINRHTEVKFQKTDGTLRTMVCTLNPRELAMLSLASLGEDQDGSIAERIGDISKVQNDPVNNNVMLDRVIVWDVDKSEWRSFRASSVIEYEVLND